MKKQIAGPGRRFMKLLICGTAAIRTGCAPVQAVVLLIKISIVKKTILCLCLLAAFSQLTAQVNPEKPKQELIQFSGLVLTDMSGQLVPVPYATIYLPMKNRGTYSDRRGFFNLVVEKKDLVRFSSLSCADHITALSRAVADPS